KESEMSYQIDPERHSVLVSVLSRGGSVREAMREANVAKHTAHRYWRMNRGLEAPASRKTQSLGDAVGICRYMPQPERLKVWESANGQLPEGKRLGWL